MQLAVSSYEVRRIRRFFVAAPLAILIFLSPGLARAQEGNVIRGKVRARNGHNLSQVTVNLETGTGSLIGQSVTNNEGDFAFGGLNDTSYVVVVSVPGYASAQERVEFSNRAGGERPGETRVLEITLVPEARSPGKVAATSTFAQDVPPDARRAFERSLKLLKDGQNGPALDALADAIKIYPDYFDAHLMLGSELLKESRIVDSIRELECARTINPGDARVYTLFGLAVMKQQRFKLAATVFEEAVKLAPGDPQPAMLKGVALIHFAFSLSNGSVADVAEVKKAIGQAEAALQRARDLSGGKAVADHQSLAMLYELTGERARAAAELDAYLRQFPKANDINSVIKWRDRLRQGQ